MRSSGGCGWKRPVSGWASAVCALSMVLLAGCSDEKDAAVSAKSGAAPVAVSVVVAPVVQKNVPIYTELTARVDATDSVDIRARVKAFLLKQSYEEGKMVKAGQVLFTLDNREYEAQLMQSQAQLAKAQADLTQAQDRTVVEVAQANLQIANAQLNKTNQDVTRLKPLAALRAVPQQDYDDALAAQEGAAANVEAKKASVNTSKVNQAAAIQQAKAQQSPRPALRICEAELNVEYCTITSPINGIAGTRQVAPGNLVGQGEPTLLTTVSTLIRCACSRASVKAVTISLPAHEKRRLRNSDGQLELILSDGSVFPKKGRIIIADRAVDLKTGTLSIVTEFPNPDALLRPGQFGRVRLAATVVDNALLVPQKAVTEMQSAKVVYVVGQDNKVVLRSIVLGQRVGPDYIVTEGLKPGERVVVEGLQKVRPGDTVNPTDQPLTSEKPRRG